MSALPLRKQAETDLVEAALKHLIDNHGSNIPMRDLPTIGGYLGVVRAGHHLKPEHIANISRVRAEIARMACRGR
jgi:hypothetical protein